MARRARRIRPRPSPCSDLSASSIASSRRRRPGPRLSRHVDPCRRCRRRRCRRCTPAHLPRARPCTTALSLSPVRGASRAQKAAERERKKEERAQKAALPKKPQSGYMLYSGPAGGKCPRSAPLRSAVARRPSPGRRPAPQRAAGAVRQRASVVAWRSLAGGSRRRRPRRHLLPVAAPA